MSAALPVDQQLAFAEKAMGKLVLRADWVKPRRVIGIIEGETEVRIIVEGDKVVRDTDVKVKKGEAGGYWRIIEEAPLLEESGVVTSEKAQIREEDSGKPSCSEEVCREEPEV